jgi:hypothetical protein
MSLQRDSTRRRCRGRRGALWPGRGVHADRQCGGRRSHRHRAQSVERSGRASAARLVPAGPASSASDASDGRNQLALLPPLYGSGPPRSLVANRRGAGPVRHQYLIRPPTGTTRRANGSGRDQDPYRHGARCPNGIAIDQSHGLHLRAYHLDPGRGQGRVMR